MLRNGHFITILSALFFVMCSQRCGGAPQSAQADIESNSLDRINSILEGANRNAIIEYDGSCAHSLFT